MYAFIHTYIHHLLWCTDFPSNSTNILIVWTDYLSEHAFPRATLPPPPFFPAPAPPMTNTHRCDLMSFPTFLFTGN